jgi:probable HAF family extracellular repeat protein
MNNLKKPSWIVLMPLWIACLYGYHLVGLLPSQCASASALARRETEPRYKVIDLGTLPGYNWSEADGINDRGQVLCTAGVRHGYDSNIFPTHAYLWEQGSRHDLGTLAQYSSSQGIAINGRGQVLGLVLKSASHSSPFRVFLWQKGAMNDLGTLLLPGVMPSALSDQGDIVGGGALDAKGSQDKAFVWRRGQARYLGLPSGSMANGVSRRRVTDPLLVAGDLPGVGFLWRSGNVSKAFVSGAWDTHLYAVNARGQAVGRVNLRTGHGHAILWQIGKITDLGTFAPRQDSNATAINNQGLIVGWTTTAPNSEMHAVLWDASGMRDLNNEINSGRGIKLERAIGINNRGEIICDGLVQGASHKLEQFLADENSGLYQHTFLLIPGNRHSSSS